MDLEYVLQIKWIRLADGLNMENEGRGELRSTPRFIG